MNGRQQRMVAWALAASLSFPGCLDKYEVSTLVSPDGTCERVIILKRDSRQLPSSAFPIPVDSSWECSWAKKPKESRGGKAEGGEEYVYTAKKRFPDFDALSREYQVPRDSASLAISIRIEKKFRWFATYYSYTETYGRFNPLRDSLPPTAFMTEDEIQRFMSSEKPDSLVAAKWRRWDQRKKDEWAFARLLEAVRKRNDPALSPGVFEENKERLIAMLSHDSTARRAEPRTQPGKVSARRKDKRGEGTEDILETLARVVGNDAVRGLKPDLDSLVSEFIARDNVASRANGEYVNTVIMPGVIVDTNAPEVRGTTVVWRFTHEHLALRDYRMQVESRVVNLWAMIVTGVLVLSVVALPFFARRRLPY